MQIDNSITTHLFGGPLKRPGIQYPIAFFIFALLAFFAFPSAASSEVVCDLAVPQIVFAAEEIEAALQETGRDDFKITLKIVPDTASPEAFRIERVGTEEIRVVGSDANGAMYGGIEVAEALILGLAIEDVNRSPLIKKRGIKMNIPWD